MTVAAPDREEIRRSFPVAAHLLSLRLSETADLPLWAIRTGVPALVCLTPSLQASLTNGASELWQELRGEGAERLGALMGRALTRYMMHRNQYLAFPRDWDREAQALYADLLHALPSAAQFERKAANLLRKHQARLRALLASREAGATAADEPLCAHYSPGLQLRLLDITPTDMPGPVLDLGCGEDAALVHELHRLGRIDAWGLDALCETNGHLFRGDWNDARFTPAAWGTILAHHSFSLHAFRAHLHGPDTTATRHARTYMRILASLKPGGSFRYAPALPFLEDLLPADQWLVRRRELPVVAPDGFRFQTACVIALPYGTTKGNTNV
ncbi:class I SAM-dependent methyltransferase [Jannaschia formosa]|uniref:class I SAM-dependent methyltransferase n=1 Tax=Jannaschia formosa TaxID=2259592 RepID=UPI000E1B7F32|nr:hypothetical protein [Jannaschia formosa]TFL16557.1 hypothetical protein DR046_19345 [Jannaschia formosa]